MNIIDPKTVDAARQIRAAIQNLNELVKDAYALDIIVQYDVRRPRHFEPGNPTIFATVSQEI